MHVDSVRLVKDCVQCVSGHRFCLECLAALGQNMDDNSDDVKSAFLGILSLVPATPAVACIVKTTSNVEDLRNGRWGGASVLNLK